MSQLTTTIKLLKTSRHAILYYGYFLRYFSLTEGATYEKKYITFSEMMIAPRDSLFPILIRMVLDAIPLYTAKPKRTNSNTDAE
jgi:hypothetical protein